MCDLSRQIAQGLEDTEQISESPHYHHRVAAPIQEEQLPENSPLLWITMKIPELLSSILQFATYRDAGRLSSVSKALRRAMDDPNRDCWESVYAKEVRMTYPLSLCGVGFQPNSWILNQDGVFETLQCVEGKMTSKQKTRLRVELRRWARCIPNSHETKMSSRSLYIFFCLDLL